MLRETAPIVTEICPTKTRIHSLACVSLVHFYSHQWSVIARSGTGRNPRKKKTPTSKHGIPNVPKTQENKVWHVSVEAHAWGERLKRKPNLNITWNVGAQKFQQCEHGRGRLPPHSTSVHVTLDNHKWIFFLRVRVGYCSQARQPACAAV